ncbi:cupin domain-containing protein [Sorangium sp. So ce1182]|uniref:cupin domain-containing protein n=1 Tax=Sorangium sp. So ce1182 TaxID=3133334 RepID=UPI003F5DB05F
MSLAELLRPLGPARFFEEHWERAPLLLAAEPGRFSHLFSSQDIGRLLTYGRTRPIDGVLLAKEGHHRDENWIGPDGAPRLDRLKDAWRDGYTLVVNNLHRLWGPVALFAAALEGELHYPVFVNVYATPPGSQGFRAHFDVTDVFVLQLEGRKAWRVREPQIELPLLDEHASSPESGLSPVLLDATLESGGVLYIPRGFVHEASAAGAGSLHLSVGVRGVTWLDLFSAALSAARGDARLRRALPPGFLGGPQGMEQRFRELLEGLSRQLALQGALDQLADELIVHRPPPPPDDLLAGEAEVGIDAVLVRRAGVACRASIGPGGACLQYSGGKLAAPPRLGPALRCVAERRAIAVRSLPGLKDAERLVLARRLVRAGVLVVEGAT